MNASQIVPFKEKVATVQGLLLSNKAAIESILPKHLTIGRLLKVVNLVIRRNPKLLDCTPQSLMGAVMEAASLGLEPGILGQAYFVPFKNSKTGKSDVQLIAGYKGLIQLCRNTGELSTIGAQVVYQSDKFEATFGTDPKITHIPTEDEKPGPVRAVYAIARLKDGGVQFDVMFRRDIEKIRKRSRSSGEGPWVTDYDEMAKKTVLRRLAKYLPASTEKMARLVELDEQAEAGLSQDFDLIEVPAIEAEANTPAEAPKPSSKLDRIVDDAKKPKKADQKPLQNPEYAEGADPEPDWNEVDSREPGSEG